MAYYREFWAVWRRLPWWQRIAFLVFNVGGISAASVAPFLEIYRSVHVGWLYMLWLSVTTLVASSIFLAGQRVWERVETERAGLAERLKPRLQVVIGRCCFLAKAARIGVANVGAESVHDALVYIDVPALGVKGLLVVWAGEPGNHPISIHPGPPEDHHHTEPFVYLSDRPGEFGLLLPFSGVGERLAAGRYQARLVVKGRDITATIAWIDIVCTAPDSIRFEISKDTG